MSFPNSPGSYSTIQDQSFIVSAGGLLAGGIVVSAKRGPVEVNTVTSAKEFVETYGLPSRDNPSMYSALRFLNRAGILSVRRVINDATGATATMQDTGATEDLLIVDAANPGAWGNDVTVTFNDTVKGAAADVFEIIVSEDGEEKERFAVSRDPDAQNGYGNNIYVEEVINTQSNLIRVTDSPAVSEDYDFTATLSLTGGADDTTAPDSAAIVSAWGEFENVDDVPAQLLINGGWAVPEVQVKMISVAQNRKDAVAILDVPQDTAEDVSAMITYVEDELTQNSYFGGIYGGWLRVYDQYNDREVVIPPSGDVAAVFVHTVNAAERWDAPAGLRRGVIPNALGVSKVLTEGERDLLYTSNINPVTTYAGAASVIWGQKTLQTQASALDRFNVVNTLLWMNQRIVEALQPFVFEPNTEFTRNSVNFLISSFLENIQQRGGLYDFYVDTSTEINTPFVIDNNQMYVDVYVKPVRTAEFIRVSTIVTPTGVELAG
jgi:hypothetical protein